MSNILSLYDALAQKSISVTPYGKNDAVTPTIKNLQSIPRNVESVDCPVRLLLMSDDSGDAQNLTRASHSGAMTTTWRITDLLLWEPTEAGLTLNGPTYRDMVAYCGAYADMLKDAARRLAGRMAFVSADIAPGNYVYPAGSERRYFGAAARLVFEEVL
jgi:hypothetical protein